MEDSKLSIESSEQRLLDDRAWLLEKETELKLKFEAEDALRHRLHFDELRNLRLEQEKRLVSRVETSPDFSTQHAVSKRVGFSTLEHGQHKLTNDKIISIYNRSSLEDSPLQKIYDQEERIRLKMITEEEFQLTRLQDEQCRLKLVHEKNCLEKVSKEAARLSKSQFEDDARWKLRKEQEILQILAKEEDIRRKRYNQELNEWRLEQERLGREMILQEEDMKRQAVEEKVSKMKHDQEVALKAELEWYVEDRRRKGIEADERWKKDQMDGLSARLDQEEEQRLRINQEQDLSHRLAKEENLRLKLLDEEEQRWHQLQQAEIILKVEKESGLRQKLQEEETRRRQKLQEEENIRWQATKENENKVWKQQKLQDSLHFFKTEEDLRQNLIVNLNGVAHDLHSNYTHGLRPDRQLTMISKYIYNDEFTGLGIEDEKTEKFKFDTKLSGVITKEFCENHPFFGRIYHDIMVCNHWKTEGKIWSFEKFILHLYEL
jgi:hypothetical protein